MYITIHDGFDANYAHMVSARASKQWPIQSWDALVYQFHDKYPDIGIVQLGTAKTAMSIGGVTRNLIDLTTITQAFDMLAQSSLHIDTDSGLAHAATALGVPCIVMFGPTPKGFYGHPQNTNLSSRESCVGGCFHLSEDWMAQCPIGYSSARCMDDITPTMVMDAVTKHLPH